MLHHGMTDESISTYKLPCFLCSFNEEMKHGYLLFSPMLVVLMHLKENYSSESFQFVFLLFFFSKKTAYS